MLAIVWNSVNKNTLKQNLEKSKFYQVSFDAYTYFVTFEENYDFTVPNNPFRENRIKLKLKKTDQNSAEDIIHEEIIANHQWKKVSFIFEAKDNYSIFEISQINQTYPGELSSWSYDYYDNFSIKEYIELPNPSEINGYIYDDGNSNGSKNAGEFGVAGIKVALFKDVQGVMTLVNETTSENLPNIGLYKFSNVVPGTYYLALKDEAVIDGITEPLKNNPLLLSNYEYVHEVIISGNQNISKNFGFKVGIQSIEVELGAVGKSNKLLMISTPTIEYNGQTLPVFIPFSWGHNGFPQNPPNNLCESISLYYDEFKNYMRKGDNVGLNHFQSFCPIGTNYILDSYSIVTCEELNTAKQKSKYKLKVDCQ
jgi:hypothetical protein